MIYILLIKTSPAYCKKVPPRASKSPTLTLRHVPTFEKALRVRVQHQTPLADR